MTDTVFDRYRPIVVELPYTAEYIIAFAHSMVDWRCQYKIIDKIQTKSNKVKPWPYLIGLYLRN